MGRNKRQSKKAHASKKTQSQVVQYKAFLGDPQNQPDDTVGIFNQHLTGSDFLHIDESPVMQPEKPVPPPVGVRVKHFFAENGIWAVIITLVVSFGCWTVINIHQNDIAIERLSVKLEYVEKIIDGLNVAGIDTETLDDELAGLKESMASSWKLDLKDIENRLNIIDMQIDDILSDISSNQSN